MRPFTPFTPEEEKIVIEALHFTRDKIRDYHWDWIDNSHPVNRGEISIERSNHDRDINNILTLLSDPKAQNILRNISDLQFIDDLILSALSIFSKELEDAIDPELSSSKQRFLMVKRLSEVNRRAH